MRTSVARRSVVALLRTSPRTVFGDYHELLNLAGYRDVIDPAADTALKVNISWHFFFPGSSTTPWQLDGVIRAMKQDGYAPERIHACHNRTVVIDAHLGERENKQLPVVEAHGLRNIHLYENEDWIPIGEAVGDLTRRFLCLNDVYPKGFHIPRRFLGENIIHLPTVKTHVFTTTTGAMKNAFGACSTSAAHWTHPVIHETLVDLLMIQQRISGVFSHGRDVRRRRPRPPAAAVPYAQERHPGQPGPGGHRRRRRAPDGVRSARRSAASDWPEAGLAWATCARSTSSGTRRRRRELELRRSRFRRMTFRGPGCSTRSTGAAPKDRVVAQDGAGAVGVPGERALPRLFWYPCSVADRCAPA
jgi:hypothetical protein